MKALITLLEYGYLALHMTASVLETFLSFAVADAVRMGPVLWLVPAGCLALLALDWSGRVSLCGTLGKLLAAFALPGLCGAVDILIWEWTIDPTPPVWGFVLSLLTLAGYVLLRERRSEDLLAEAEATLERGSCLTIAVAGWLYLLGGLFFLVAVFGCLITLIIGALLASKNTLLDYSGMRGLLLGLVLLHLVQSLTFWRGARLARKAIPELDYSGPLITLFLPIWNLAQAGRLASRVRERIRQEGGGPVWVEY